MNLEQFKKRMKRVTAYAKDKKNIHWTRIYSEANRLNWRYKYYGVSEDSVQRLVSLIKRNFSKKELKVFVGVSVSPYKVGYRYATSVSVHYWNPEELEYWNNKEEIRRITQEVKSAMGLTLKGVEALDKLLDKIKEMR